MKQYWLITYYQKQYGSDRMYTEVIEGSIATFIVQSAAYIAQYPEQKYDMPQIIWSHQLTEGEYKKVRNSY